MQTYQIDANLLDWTIKAIQKACAEDIYKKCVVPDFGEKVLARLYEIKEQPKAEA